MTFTIPTLQTERLVLRAFSAADHAAFARMESDPGVREFRGGNTLDAAQAWSSMQMILGQWALRGYGVFALGDNAQGGAFIGFAGVLHPAGWAEPEIAYSLDRPYWGGGLALEAATAARSWAFGQFGFPLLVSFIAPANHRSKRVAAKLGAVHDSMTSIRGNPAERWIHPGSGRGVVA